MSKKNMKLYSLSDIARELDVPLYRIRYLFTKRKLKQEDYPYVGKSPIFIEEDIEKIKGLLAGINTFTWKEKAINQ